MLLIKKIKSLVGLFIETLMQYIECTYTLYDILLGQDRGTCKSEVSLSWSNIIQEQLHCNVAFKIYKNVLLKYVKHKINLRVNGICFLLVLYFLHIKWSSYLDKESW